MQSQTGQDTQHNANDIYFICLNSSNPPDLSHKKPRVKCPYFTEAIAASVNTDFFQEEKSWRKGRRF